MEPSSTDYDVQDQPVSQVRHQFPTQSHCRCASQDFPQSLVGDMPRRQWRSVCRGHWQSMRQVGRENVTTPQINSIGRGSNPVEPVSKKMRLKDYLCHLSLIINGASNTSTIILWHYLVATEVTFLGFFFYIVTSSLRHLTWISQPLLS